MLKTSQLDFPEVSVLWILIAYFSDLSDLLNTFLMLHFLHYISHYNILVNSLSTLCQPGTK